jgi:hypothetical protein
VTADADELQRTVEERLAAVERDVTALVDHVHDSAPVRSYEALRRLTHTVRSRLATPARRGAIVVVVAVAALAVAVALRHRDA